MATYTVTNPESNIKMCVYSITHITSGKIYIGQTINLAGARWRQHICQHASSGISAIKSAIKKYGVAEFNFNVIDIADSQSQLDHKEMFWISYYGSISPEGYNLGLGGNGKGKVSKETRQKISNAKLGKTTSRKGGKLPQEWIDKMVKAKTGMAVPAKYKPIICNNGDKYISVGHAVSAIGCNKATLMKHLSGRLKTIYGKTYRYIGGLSLLPTI